MARPEDVFILGKGISRDLGCFSPRFKAAGGARMAQQPLPRLFSPDFAPEHPLVQYLPAGPPCFLATPLLAAAAFTCRAANRVAKN